MRSLEREERTKAISLVQARAEAEKQTISMLTTAEARHKEAEELAKAAAIDTKSQAARVTAMAEADSQAEKERAGAYEIGREIEARTLVAITEAENLMSGEQIDMKIRMSVIENLKDIIRESARPMENIDDIKIVQVNGMLGGPGGNSLGAANGESG